MNIHTLSDLKKPKKAAKGKKTAPKGGVHTLADFKQEEGVKKQKLKKDDEEDAYFPEHTLRDADTDDDEDLLEEASKDYSGDEWEEEGQDGKITIHNSGGPDDDKVRAGVLGDARWGLARSRGRKSFRRVIKKATINSTHSNSTDMDFSFKAGTGGGRYVWIEDNEFGTHTLKVVRGENGTFRPRYTLIRGVEGESKGGAKGGKGAEAGVKRGRKRAKIMDEEDEEDEEYEDE